MCSCNGVSFTHFTGKPWQGFNGLGWYDNRARVLDALTGRFTTPDPLAEKYPWESPYAHCAGNPVKNIDLVGLAPTPYEAALMAKHVYGGQDAIDVKDQLESTNWQISTFSTSIKKNAPWYGNGLNSELYERELSNGEKEYAYVFAGTNSIEDVSQDVLQLLGMSNQYSSAVSNAKTLDIELRKSELTFIGHSLGGGEAAASSMATGRLAITFNPAALSRSTIANLFLNNMGNIVNYVVLGKEIIGGIQGGGDPVYNLQDNLGMKLPGKTITIPSNSYNMMHGIDSFLKLKLPNYE